ncbi:hypothetical protein EMCRGX_G003920 [Ephydatia muelleri]
MLSEIYSRLNISLVRSVARAIMGRDAVQGFAWDIRTPAFSIDTLYFGWIATAHTPLIESLVSLSSVQLSPEPLQVESGSDQAMTSPRHQLSDLFTGSNAL